MKIISKRFDSYAAVISSSYQKAGDACLNTLGCTLRADQGGESDRVMTVMNVINTSNMNPSTKKELCEC